MAIIGSGATAVTAFPAVAKVAKHVTLVQRTPSYILSSPLEDNLGKIINHRLPDRILHFINRWPIWYSIYYANLVDDILCLTCNAVKFFNEVFSGFRMSMPPFSWSIFIRAVKDHMICYNFNWPKIKLWVQYFVFSCALDHILKY